MYESHFGIQAAPFRLSPDPSFYFDSSEHRRVRDIVDQGLRLDAGLVVVSGEIGAGKTMLVQTALSRWSTRNAVVAQVLSSQLDAAELLDAILSAFGLRADDEPAGQKRAALLAALGASPARRPAFLVIDEAHNLSLQALCELEPLLKEAVAREVPLVVVLVGQPELRGTLGSPDLQGLCCGMVSCHLAAMDAGQTGAYIRHRLERAGWSGRPSFVGAAFDEIFRWTDGIPRRINRLCDRLLLSRFIASQDRIDADVVANVACALREEMGEATGPTEPAAAPAADLGECVLCVVDGLADHVKAAPLMHALASRAELAPPRLVRTSANDALRLTQALFGDFVRSAVTIELSESAASPHARAPDLGARFEELLDRCRARAVIVFDSSEAARACAWAANRRDVPVAHVGAGLRAPAESATCAGKRRMTEAVAELLFAVDARGAASLLNEGVELGRIRCDGSLLADALAMPGPERLPQEQATPTAAAESTRTSYAVVSLSLDSHIDDPRKAAALVMLLRDVSRDLPLVWPLHPRMAESLMRAGLLATMEGERIACLQRQPHGAFVDLVRDAVCVLTDSPDVEDEAAALGTPCLIVGDGQPRIDASYGGGNAAIGTSRTRAARAVWDCLFNGPRPVTRPTAWDGMTAQRMAARIVELLAVRTSQP